MAALSPGCKPRIPQNYSEIVFLPALDRGTRFFFHENPPSRNSVIADTKYRFFPSPASVPKFWRIPHPAVASNPLSR